MGIDEWIGWWINRVKTTRFDARDLYNMFICQINDDIREGKAPVESANECLEEAEDFISRYGGGKKC